MKTQIRSSFLESIASILSAKPLLRKPTSTPDPHPVHSKIPTSQYHLSLILTRNQVPNHQLLQPTPASSGILKFNQDALQILSRNNHTLLGPVIQALIPIQHNPQNLRV